VNKFAVAASRQSAAENADVGIGLKLLSWLMVEVCNKVGQASSLSLQNPGIPLRLRGFALPKTQTCKPVENNYSQSMATRFLVKPAGRWSAARTCLASRIDSRVDCRQRVMAALTVGEIIDANNTRKCAQ
jgi:hypothetical protein